MSADNGVYILRTKDHQHRVIYAHAISSLYHSFIESINEELVPTRIVERFGDTQYTTNTEIAFKIASYLAKGTDLEYGIQIIPINKTWRQIIKEAKMLAPLEIEAIHNKNQNGLWNQELEKLQKIIGEG